MDMPALTHDFFSRDAFDIAAGKLGFYDGRREAFLLGNQGPDPLFYLATDPLLHRLHKYASIMHKRNARTSSFYARYELHLCHLRHFALLAILQVPLPLYA